MKLARVEHIRCGEYAGYTYLMVPDDLTEEQFQQDVNEVVAEYVRDVDLFNQQDPPVALLDIRTHEFPPGTTVEQARAIVKVREQESNDWYARRAAFAKDFSHYIKARGYIPIHEADHLAADADWGHRHGQTFKYSADQLGYSPGLVHSVKLTRKAIV